LAGLGLKVEVSVKRGIEKFRLIVEKSEDDDKTETLESDQEENKL
jgi:hypothetical protein